MARSKSDATKPVDMLDELAEQFSVEYTMHGTYAFAVGTIQQIMLQNLRHELAEQFSARSIHTVEERCS